MDTSIIIALISVAGTVVIGFLQLKVFKSQARKTDAEADNITLKSSIDVNLFYQDLIKSILEERDYFKTENLRLRAELDTIRDELREREKQEMSKEKTVPRDSILKIGDTK